MAAKKPRWPQKLGKAPHTEDKRDARLAEFLSPSSPRLADTGNYAMVDGRLYDFEEFPWGMLGNDKVGDCVPAMAAHSQLLDDAEGHRRLPGFVDDSVLGDYSAVTGYVKGKPSTDRGTEMREYLGYWRHTGIDDAAGRRHRIGFYAALDPKDLEQLAATVRAIGKVPIGFEVPAYAMDQFNAGEPFHLIDGDDEIVGGHCVLVAGILGGYLVVVTWGTLALMAPDFYVRYNDESWGYATGAMLDPQSGLTISGLDVEKVRAYVRGLKGS